MTDREAAARDWLCRNDWRRDEIRGMCLQLEEMRASVNKSVATIQDVKVQTQPIFKIKKELRSEMPDKFKITKKEVTPDGILIEAVPEENKYPFVEIVPEYKEINPEVADQLDRFLDEKIEAIDEEIKMHAKVVEKLVNLMDSWAEIKKRVEGTK